MSKTISELYSEATGSAKDTLGKNVMQIQGGQLDKNQSRDIFTIGPIGLAGADPQGAFKLGERKGDGNFSLGAGQTAENYGNVDTHYADNKGVFSGIPATAKQYVHYSPDSPYVANSETKPGIPQAGLTANTQS